ncbi:MAG: Mov34/MPN/PAD-1 family protein [Planctomycetaceae bacterium]|nr:Mov34/MPN/PAD-1 family protein [Planctomycetaceae bacterium]
MPATQDSSVGNATATRRYRFYLNLNDAKGSLVSRTRLTDADFRLAQLAFQFERLRRDASFTYCADLHATQIVPHFADALQPSCVGFDVSDRTGSDESSITFDNDYFQHRVLSIAATLQREGKVAIGASLAYFLEAHADDEERQSSTPEIKIGTPRALISIGERARADWGASEPWDSPSADQMPMLLSRRVIDEIVAEAAATPEREIGGLLIGRLWREPTGDLYGVITAAVSGASTMTGDAVSVTFTPETLRKGRTFLASRSADHPGEQILGQYHSHPHGLCQDCPLIPPPECLDKIFFASLQDHHLMSSTFDQPFMVGLVVGVEPRLAQGLGHAPIRMFGWQRGVLKPRGFDVVDR